MYSAELEYTLEEWSKIRMALFNAGDEELSYRVDQDVRNFILTSPKFQSTKEINDEFEAFVNGEEE